MSESQLGEGEPELLAELEDRYSWWDEPKGQRRSRRRVLAQVMDLGTFEDGQRAWEFFGVDAFIDVLRNAVMGWLRPHSWAYWHYRCRLIEPREEPPPMPTRFPPPQEVD